MLRHRAARGRGPQRRPAGAQCGHEFGFGIDAEETFELAGKIAIGAILNQSRRAHRGRLSLRAPCGDDFVIELRRQRFLIKF
jgi:hypothetical protein